MFKKKIFLKLILFLSFLLVGFNASNYVTTDGMTHRAKPKSSNDKCEPADSNITRAARAILREAQFSLRKKNIAHWGKSNTWRFFKLLKQRFALNRHEILLLQKQGLVVPAKLTFPSYTMAYHEIYVSQLPIFVSVDSILHTIYASNDRLIKDIEKKLLVSLLKKTINKLQVGLNRFKKKYNKQMLQDIDLYLSVAHSLLHATTQTPKWGNRKQLKKILTLIYKAKGLHTVKIFGRNRVIDFSQFTPRGHYTDKKLTPYFRAATWLARLEFNIVSRSCRSSQPGTHPNPRETPRETRSALALADLAMRTGSFVEIDQLNKAWTFLAGKREDISLSQLHILRQKARIRSLRRGAIIQRIKRVIGNKFQRTVNTHYMPQGTKTLPAIMTLLGPRITPDTTAIRQLINPIVPNRRLISALDMARVLGNKRAQHHLRKEIKKYRKLKNQLNKTTKLVKANNKGKDLYSSWLRAIQALAKKPRGILPTMMRTPAYADLRLNSTVASFGQIKHNYVLMAAQAYDFGGCEIPDGFVEPAPALYNALIKYSENGARILSQLDPYNKTKAGAYFKRLKNILTVLLTISKHQLANRPLTKNMRRYLSMVVEMKAGGTGLPPTYTGWYFDLFYNRKDALKESHFITDFYTSSYKRKIAYSGVSKVRMGLFLINSCGKPRLMAGPVARSFQYVGPLKKRYSDKDVPMLKQTTDPWAKGYTMQSKPEPPLLFSIDQTDGFVLTLASTKKLGLIKITLLDHHRRPIKKLSFIISNKRKSYKLTKLPKTTVEAVHFEINGFHFWQEVDWTGCRVTLGGMK